MGGLNKGSKDTFAEVYGKCELVLRCKKHMKPQRVGGGARKIGKSHSRKPRRRKIKSSRGHTV